MKPKTSKIVLGTDWMVAIPNLASWNILPTKRADAILSSAVEKGINSFDTARMYWSEGIVGRFVSKHPLGRHAFRIISKGGHPRPFWRTPLTRRTLLRQLDASLRALGTDYIDVYLLHYDDPRVSAQEFTEWSIELLKSGKVLNIGYSNVSLPRLTEFRSYLEEASVVPWVSNEFNALPANGEERWKGAQNVSGNAAYLNYLRDNRLPFLAYSPLGRGDLKRIVDHRFNGRNPEYDRAAGRLISLGQKYGAPPSAIALSYILQTGSDFHAVVGTSKLKHLAENMQALTVRMSESDWTDLAFPQRSS